MKPISIDFAPRSARRAVLRAGPVSWLLAAAGLALLGGSSLVLRPSGAEQEARGGELAQLRAQLRERAARQAGARPALVSDAQAGAVNRAIEQLNLPWSRLLDTLEHATPRSIALIELAPDAKRRLVKGTAEAETAAAMLGYVSRLKRQPFFADVTLTRHAVDAAEAGRPVRFEFEAAWAGRES